MNKLKERWGVSSNLQLVIVFIVFSITGSLSVFLTKPILGVIGINKETLNLFLYYLLKILILFPIYQILLVIVGSIFGQRVFFWNFEKKMLVRLKLYKIVNFVERTFGW